MDPDMEVDRQRNEGSDEEERKKRRPPSSYGSMKSDSDEDEEVVRQEFAFNLPHTTTQSEARLQPIRADSPETLHTMTTQQLPNQALVIDTRSNDQRSCSESERDLVKTNRVFITNSPEPPEAVEPDNTMQTDEGSHSGSLHPDQGLPHIFKCIQGILMRLTSAELLSFKIWFLQCEPNLTKQQVMEGDILDFVDRMLEILGQDRVLTLTISTLEIVNKPLADELRNQCKKALLRCCLKQHLIRKHRVIREGVPRAGRRSYLDTIYTEPRISTSCYGGVDPSHELRQHPPSHLAVPGADTYVGLNDLFRLRKGDGGPARTVLTTGIPGIGMSVSVGKFSLDWAELRANKDLQFVIKLSFRTFWLLRNRKPPGSSKMSILEVMEYYYPELKDMSFLEEDCKYLIIMDSFDCYQAPLDWENAPVIGDNNTQAHPDVLIVNILRGTVFRGAHIWILGRQAAVSEIPSKFIDVVTEIQGFSDEMKDDFLSRRFSDAELAANIVAHYKRLPTLRVLAGQPFVCWMVATVFERCYAYLDYGVHPPRLTPFYLSIVIVQTNRRLQFYYGKAENDLKWSSDDKDLLTKMGNMALTMLEKRTSVFSEEDVQQCGLKLAEVTVFSGLCTELPAADGRRRFCFIHLTVQEFMAALYVFIMFHTECKNVLDSGGLRAPKIFASKHQTKSAAELVQCALERTLGARLGDYDMFLRFLCGLLSPRCHGNQLRGFLFPHNTPKVGGLEKVQQLLEQKIHAAPADRVENLKECLREMTQGDE